MKHLQHVAHHTATHYVAHHFSLPVDAVQHVAHVAAHYLRVLAVALVAVL